MDGIRFPSPAPPYFPEPTPHPPTRALTMAAVITLGWRERVALPDLGITGLKAKLDTGARSSALHVDTLEVFRRDGTDWLRFEVSSGRRRVRAWQAEAAASDRRVVTDTGGHRSERWFIRSMVSVAGEVYPIDISLTDRRHMLFPMLLGRTAIAGRFAVDPRLSYTQPRAERAVTDTP